jgi:hypothetical protein
MIGRKRLLRVSAVLAVAFATGQAVESLRASAALSGRAASAMSADHVPSSASLYTGVGGVLPDLKGITPVAASEKPASDSCAPALSLTASAGAMIDLVLVAPCDPGERIVIRHAGLSFTALVGPDGRLSLSLPALESDALVAAYFEGSAVALASVTVPDAAKSSRFAFQVPFPVDFTLRAEEGDAVYVGGSRRPWQADTGKIVSLGSEAVAQPMLAQVYTFPGTDLASSVLSVEIRITDQTCSRSFVAESWITHGGSVSRRTQPVAIPLCGGSGDILVLKNLVPDLTLAAPR